MMEKPKAALLDRIEAGAREVWPIWEWLFIVWLVGLPILLGFVYVAFAERNAGGVLHWEDYQTILWVMAGFTAAILVVTMMVTSRGWHRKLIGWRDPSKLVPGPFRLGSSLLGIYYRPWWGTVLSPIVVLVLIDLVDDGEATSVLEIYRMGQALFGWFFAVVVAFMGVVSLAGLAIQQRLRQRDRTA